MGRRQTQNDMCLFVAGEVRDALRRTIPELKNRQDRGFAFVFIVHIRNGIATFIETDTWDDSFAPVVHVRATPIDEMLKQIDGFLLNNLPLKLIAGYHGHVEMRVTLFNQTLSFGVKMRRSKKLDFDVG